jgi:hypothetical protein
MELSEALARSTAESARIIAEHARVVAQLGDAGIEIKLLREKIAALLARIFGVQSESSGAR